MSITLICLSPLQERLLDLLQNYPDGLTRPEICQHLQVPRTTAYDNLLKLQHLGYVDRIKAPARWRGRPRTIWKFRQEAFR